MKNTISVLNTVSPQMGERLMIKRLLILACSGVAAVLLSAGAYAGSNCEGDAKVEGEGPTTYFAPAGGAIASVCIKAGRAAYDFYPVDAGDGCYELHWVDDTQVTIGGGGTGRSCRAISHTAVTYGPGCEKDCPPPPCEKDCPKP
jgi:hypothetical protein